MSENEAVFDYRTIPTEQLEQQLKLVVSSRIGEVYVTWTIFSVFWAAQILLLGALLQGTFPPHPTAVLIASVVGIIMAIVWGHVQDRSLKHLERFECLTKRIEDQLQTRGALASAHRLYQSTPFQGYPSRKVMRASCWIAGIGWGVGLVICLMIFACCARCGESCSW